MTTTDTLHVTISNATPGELPIINAVIAQAVATWPLPPRLKKLALPLLRYDAIDADDYDFLLATARRGEVAGVAVLDRSVVFTLAKSAGSMLLHGIYVGADFQRQGVGRRLQAAVFERAARAGAAGVIVKAERVAAPYFERCGYERIDSSAYGFSYPYSYRRRLDAQPREAAGVAKRRSKRSA